MVLEGDSRDAGFIGIDGNNGLRPGSQNAFQDRHHPAQLFRLGHRRALGHFHAGAGGFAPQIKQIGA